jgi:cytochrome c-type biogenesis protein CcmE
VVYSSLETPDLFKDGAEVVVEGRLAGSDHRTFEATHILAKCPSKFEAKASGQAAL